MNHRAAFACAAGITLPALGQAAPPAVPAAPPAAPTANNDAASLRADAALRRAMPPRPDRVRIDRALAIAGLTERVPATDIERELAAAARAFEAWRTDASTQAHATVRDAMRAHRAPGLPAACIPTLLDLRPNGLRFEADALDALLRPLPADAAASGPLAREALTALQAQACLGAGAGLGFEDLGRVDLLEAALATAAHDASLQRQVRDSLAGYEADRARILGEMARAAISCDGRAAEVMPVMQAWVDAHQGPEANTAAPAGAGPLAAALQAAPLIDGAARMADLQHRTAERLAGLLSAPDAWQVVVRMLAGQRRDTPDAVIRTLLADAAGWPADRRDAALERIRAYCASDLPAARKAVLKVAQSLQALATPLRGSAVVSLRGLTPAQLDAIDAALGSAGTAAASYGTLSTVDERLRAVRALDRELRSASP